MVRIHTYMYIVYDRLGATLTTLREYTVDEGRKAVEVLVRKVPDDQQVS